MTRWMIRRTVWGWSLYEHGALVASADHPNKLLSSAFMGGQG